MLAGQRCERRIPYKRGAYALVLIRRNAHSLPAPAKQHTLFELIAFHTACHRMCEIRIIRGVSAICSEILHFETVGGKPVDNRLLVGETCVIGADSNFSHYFFVNYSPLFVNHGGQSEKFFIID
jgi:hypothetical protein